jgi:glycosyltransferase involved in cell wall biosynthesis
LVRDAAPDLIQGWMYHGNLAASAAAAWNGRPIPVLWNIRQTLPTLRNETPLTALAILAGAPLSTTAQAIVYNSQRAADDHERLHYAKARRVIIANGFDLSLLYADASAHGRLSRALGLPADAPIVGRVGNFHLHKDFPTLIAAFARIAAAEPRAHLVLVGRGVDASNEELAALLRALPPRRVHLLGERRDVAAIMPGFDVLVSSSSAEAFPNVIGEAMACGVPTVTTDAGDCREILGDPARVVPLHDVLALAAKVLDVLALDADARAALGQRDRTRVSERYSLAAVAAEYVALWRRATAGA